MPASGGSPASSTRYRAGSALPGPGGPWCPGVRRGGRGAGVRVFPCQPRQIARERRPGGPWWPGDVHRPPASSCRILSHSRDRTGAGEQDRKPGAASSSRPQRRGPPGPAGTARTGKTVQAAPSTGPEARCSFTRDRQDRDYRDYCTWTTPGRPIRIALDSEGQQDRQAGQGPEARCRRGALAFDRTGAGEQDRKPGAASSSRPQRRGPAGPPQGPPGPRLLHLDDARAADPDRTR